MKTRKKPPAEAPNVTVVIPTHNRAHLFGRAIQSVLQQTYEDFELIVLEDASTHDTREVVEGFVDPRLRDVRHGEKRDARTTKHRHLDQ